MENIIRILNESGVSERMQKSINRVTKVIDGDIPQEVIDHSIADMICLEAIRNEELEEAILEYAVNKTIPKIVDALGIKYQPESKDEEVPLSVKILETILQEIIK